MLLCLQLARRDRRHNALAHAQLSRQVLSVLWNSLNSVRIVLLGKTGSGKSSLANTIFGQKVFTIGHLPVSESSPSRAETRLVCGRNITLIDTRCVFDTSVSENDLKEEILSCITQCAPGPHVFLIVLKVEKFTEHEKDVIKTICQHFSEDALKFAAVVFTHGDQLPVGMRIEEFVGQNKSLSDLLRRCGGRCHVVDNKYWKVDGDDPYRSNKSQVTEILKTTEKISMTNGGKCYTNEILQQGELTVHFFCVSFTFLFCSADGNPPTDQCANHHCIIKHYPCFPPVPTTVRIVLLGKSGNGKSSLANTFLGTPVFRVTLFDNSKGFSQVETKCMNGKSLSLIDTPGLFDPGGSEKDTKPELTRCLLECAPGLHVFLIVLKVDKFTKQQQAAVSNIREYFSGDALKYAVVVFTHGDQLPEGMKIEEFVDQSEELKELVEKCGGRCHVFDCKYWKNNDQEDAYRSNQLQMAELLNTIDKILMENTGGYYTNTILKKVEREIQEEESLIQEASQDMSKEEIRELAKGHVLQKQLEGSRPSWIKIGLVVTGLLAAVSAVCIASMESPSEQTIAEEACESAAVEEVDEETIPAEFFFICLNKYSTLSIHLSEHGCFKKSKSSHQFLSVRKTFLALPYFCFC
uniref:AIG1-type G domain-containing protein n=1 Tax=Nothobranchius furzeri TaxID=105023 RepID=A0A8C6P6P8_NOTFU